MNVKSVIVGSRESQLAVKQSMMVMEYLKAVLPESKITLLTMKTIGDKILDQTLDKVGGKGLFVKELDLALMDRRVDITVHSLKDVPMQMAEGLPFVAFSKREDPRDVLVLPEGKTEPDPLLPIGTSSLRRMLQLKEFYPGYQFEPVRGNLQTRLKKLDEGSYGALVLAAAGLKRMGLAHRISRFFSVDEIIPAAGQGIIAVQGRSGEDYSYLDGFNDKNARLAALCERAYVRELNGGCTSPVCAYAEVKDEKILLRALYYDGPTGSWIIDRMEGSADDPEQLGVAMAKKLIRKMENGR